MNKQVRAQCRSWQLLTAVLPGLLMVPNAGASGALSLPWQDGADSGSAFSSGVTAADSASALWFNPAGLAGLENRQYVAGATLVAFRTAFEGSARRAGTDDSAISGRNGSVPVDGGNPGGLNPPLPQLYYARPLNQRWGIGFGLNTPYAIISKYEENWIGRYHAIETSIITTQFGPAVGWQATERLRLGAGLNISLWGSRFSNDVDLGAILERRIRDGCEQQFPSPADRAACLGVAPSGLGGRYDFYNELDALGPGIGLTLGLQWQALDTLVLGLNYRSPVTHQLNGKAKRNRFGSGPDGQRGWDGDELRNDPDLQPLRTFLDGQAALNPEVEDFEERIVQPALAGSSDGKFDLRVVLPEQLVGGFRLSLGPWTTTGAVNWTRWERFNEFLFDFEDGKGAILAFAEFNESFRYSLGTEYAVSNTLRFRGGLAYEQGAVKDETRSARAPDGDRIYLSGGFGWQIAESWLLNVSAGGFRAQGGPVNDVARASGSGNVLQGKFDNLASIFAGLQIGYVLPW